MKYTLKIYSICFQKAFQNDYRTLSITYVAQVLFPLKSNTWEIKKKRRIVNQKKTQLKYKLKHVKKDEERNPMLTLTERRLAWLRWHLVTGPSGQERNREEGLLHDPEGVTPRGEDAPQRVPPNTGILTPRKRKHRDNEKSDKPTITVRHFGAVFRNRGKHTKTGRRQRPGRRSPRPSPAWPPAHVQTQLQPATQNTVFPRARDVTPIYTEHKTTLEKSQRNEINVYSETMMELKPEITTKKKCRKKSNVRKLEHSSK